ncbi:hypothetical protein [Leptospira kmetyi]|uniref:hypothetical protein n=1 Tax=Leptospira kmetyi TaxID=408139 RepID=UPI003EBE7F65
MENIEPKLDIQETFLKSFADPLKDTSELMLDELLEDGSVLEKINGISLVVSAVKFTNKIAAKRFAKRLYHFIHSVHTNAPLDDWMKKFKDRLSSDQKTQAKTIEQILEWLEGFPADIHSKILSKLFISFVEGSLSYERFIRLGTAIQNINPYGFAIIEPILKNTGYDQPDKNERISYLAGSGLLLHESSGTFGGGSFPEITELGKELFEYGLKDLELP